MSFFEHYALLIAIAIPVVALVGLNAFLYFGGERGTLMFPSLAPYPTADHLPDAAEMLARAAAKEAMAAAEADESAREQRKAA